tara:strand:- start:12 stop:503 length:492 start_codon:yes stop_codon:yes gene_type:complete
MSERLVFRPTFRVFSRPQLATLQPRLLKDHLDDLDDYEIRLASLRASIFAPVLARSKKDLAGAKKARFFSRASAAAGLVTAPFSAGALLVVSIVGGLAGLTGAALTETDAQRRAKIYAHDHDNLRKIDDELAKIIRCRIDIDDITTWITNGRPGARPPPPTRY